MSGRDQISADGKHLIDGVAFGPPRLKAPRDRPPVDIPPLKRRRITYDEESQDEEPQLLLTERGEGDRDHQRLRVHARFDNTDGDGFGAEGDEGDDDFVDDADGNTDEDDGDFGDLDMDRDDLPASDIQDELRDLQMDNELALQGQKPNNYRISDKAAQPSAQEGETNLDLETLDKLSALRAAFPTAPVDVCEWALLLHSRNLKLAYCRLGTLHKPVMSMNDTVLAFDNTTRPRPEEPATADMAEVAEVEEHGEPGEPDELSDSEAESVASMVKHYDQHGFPGGSILAGTASTHMAETMRQAGHPVKAPVHTKFDENCNTRHDRLYSHVSGVDSGSGSDSDSDSGPETASSKLPKTSAGAKLTGSKRSPISNDIDSDSDSDSDSTSDSESESESSSDSDDGSYDSDDSGASSDVVRSIDDSSDEESQGRARSTSDSSSSAGESDDSEADTSSDEDSSHGSTGGALKSHAARKTVTAAPSLQHEKSIQQPGPVSAPAAPLPMPRDVTTLVPPGQGKTATQRRNARRRTALKALKAAARGEAWPESAESIGVFPETESAGFNEAIAAKKVALLQSLELLGVPSQEAEDGVSKDLSTHPISQASMVSGLHPDRPSPTREPVDTDLAATASQQKSKLDVGAGRQILFAALGLKNPKTKADEDQLRSTLITGIQPLVNQRMLDSANSQHQQPQDKGSGEQDPDAWRDKIIYRAVECCHDGVELSEPPFPFVQRWDPQQQYFSREKNQRGGRSKRKQRNQAEFLDEESQSSTKRRKYAGGAMEYDDDEYREESYTHQESGTGYEDTVLNYDDEPQETPMQTQPAPSQDADEEDLPTLPADLTSLPILGAGQASPGMIVTWKQWMLSKATNWQPQVSERTGIVVEALNDSTLTVRLAKRDRNLDRNEKVYDDDGNRVYDKFELPGSDDEDEEADEQGYRTLEVADMIEPRILRPGPEAVEIRQEEVQPSIDRMSVTLDREEEVGKGRFDSYQANLDSQHGGQSIISETGVSYVLPDDVSMSEDRRHEISLLINDAGFRKDVDPSVTKSASLNLSSPSRQLEEMIQVAPAATLEVSNGQNPAGSETPSQTTSNNIDSQPILLEPFHGFSDAVSESPDEGRVAYPKLDLPPSDTGSIHSGRQVDPDYSIELGNGSFQGLDDGGGVSSSVLHHDSDNKQEGSESDSSDASFPSLSELWPTASTGGSRSPGKADAVSASKAWKSDVVPDLEYEEAMRRLDNNDDLSEVDEEDQQQQQLSKLAQKLVDKPIKKPTPKKPAQQKGSSKPLTAPHIKTERASPNPATLGSRAKSGRSARVTSPSFVVPQGSQVVSLLSSSPEPEMEEHYAEDSMDETYQEPSSLPKGPGWAKKSRSRRDISMPAPSTAWEAPTPKRFASSQSKQGAASKEAVMNSLERAKRKVLANRF